MKCIDKPEILFQATNTYDRDWNEWFDREDIDPVRISNDELSVDPLGTSCRVVTSLELDTADADDVTRGTAKMADATDQAWQARYRVVIILTSTQSFALEGQFISSERRKFTALRTSELATCCHEEPEPLSDRHHPSVGRPTSSFFGLLGPLAIPASASAPLHQLLPTRVSCDMWKPAVAISVSDLGNDHVVSLVPPSLLPLGVTMRGVSHEFFKAFSGCPVIDRVAKRSVRRSPRFFSEEAIDGRSPCPDLGVSVVEFLIDDTWAEDE